jgi:mycothiol system anti-sigma-R factor
MLQHVYEFLDHELDTATSDEIRQHLAGCEPCLDRFDLEQAVKSLVSRSCGSDIAPPALRTKVMDRLAAAKKAAYLGSDGFGPSA